MSCKKCGLIRTLGVNVRTRKRFSEREVDGPWGNGEHEYKGPMASTSIGHNKYIKYKKKKIKQ